MINTDLPISKVRYNDIQISIKDVELETENLSLQNELSSTQSQLNTVETNLADTIIERDNLQTQLETVIDELEIANDRIAELENNSNNKISVEEYVYNNTHIIKGFENLAGGDTVQPSEAGEDFTLSLNIENLKVSFEWIRNGNIISSISDKITLTNLTDTIELGHPIDIVWPFCESTDYWSMMGPDLGIKINLKLIDAESNPHYEIEVISYEADGGPAPESELIWTKSQLQYSYIPKNNSVENVNLNALVIPVLGLQTYAGSSDYFNNAYACACLHKNDFSALTDVEKSFVETIIGDPNFFECSWITDNVADKVNYCSINSCEVYAPWGKSYLLKIVENNGETVTLVNDSTQYGHFLSYTPILYLNGNCVYGNINADSYTKCFTVNVEAINVYVFAFTDDYTTTLVDMPLGNSYLYSGNDGHYIFNEDNTVIFNTDDTSITGTFIREGNTLTLNLNDNVKQATLFYSSGAPSLRVDSMTYCCA